MTITFLGTGTSQGVPVIACSCPVCHSTDSRDVRLRTSALLTDSEGNNVLVDIGPDFRAQMLRSGVQHLEGILITHAHRDHVGGIDDIRAFNWVQQKKMEVYANTVALATLQNDYHYIFEPHQFVGLPEANLHDVSDCTPFPVGRFVVTPVRGMHKDLPVLGFRFEEQGATLAYLTDINAIPDTEMDKLRSLDMLVINALRKEKHFSHFCLPEALEVIAAARPASAYIIHMSHQMGFHAQVEASLPEGVHLAYDGLKLNVKQLP